MKHIVVGILTIVILGLMGLTFMGGLAYHGGEAGHVIPNMGKRTANSASTQIAEKDDRAKEMDKIKALQDCGCAIHKTA